MRHNELFKMFVDKWGMDKTIYILSTTLLGTGIGLFVGFCTSRLTIEKENIL